MINIKYPLAYTQQVSDWQTRLYTLFAKYKFIEDDNLTEPLLTEGIKEVSGVNAIGAYIDELESLVAGWYEDRCDKYEFDPDAK